MEEEKELYTGKMSTAVLQNVLPAMASSLLMLVYNLADTFFIGQTHNDLMLAAVSLATPVYLLFMSLGTLFGVGGASVVSRALGAGEKERAHRASSFCVWISSAAAIAMMLIVWIFMEQILAALGASADTIDYTRTYLTIVSGGGLFLTLSFSLTNLIRAEGRPKIAMTGTIIGNILNIILDPILILMLGWGIRGAAIATLVGNAVGAVYYVTYVLSGKFSLSANIRNVRFGGGIARDVLAIGFPSALGSIIMSFSQILANGMIAAYGDMPLAAYGVAAKVRMCYNTIGGGVGQGVQPMLAYYFGAKNRKRFKPCLYFALKFALVLFAVTTILCFVFARPIVQIFLTDQSALDYAVLFTRMMLVTQWAIGVYDVYMASLQATGEATKAFIAAITGQGIVYIPALFVFGALLGLNGLVLAQPFSEAVGVVMMMILSGMAVRKFYAGWNEKESV